MPCSPGCVMAILWHGWRALGGLRAAQPLRPVMLSQTPKGCDKAWEQGDCGVTAQATWATVEAWLHRASGRVLLLLLNVNGALEDYFCSDTHKVHIIMQTMPHGAKHHADISNVTFACTAVCIPVQFRMKLCTMASVRLGVARCCRLSMPFRAACSHLGTPV